VIVISDLETRHVAAFTADMDGSPVAVVNSLARVDPVVREEAMRALAAAGIDAATIHEVLANGIRR
jgi:hypothetical protein